MKADFTNTVIVMGADHHNTLAAIRCLGERKCDMSVLIHTHREDPRSLKVSHSRYAAGKTVCVAETESAILQWLLTHIKAEKQILFPCSDLSAYTIDTNFDKLCEHYIIPGFKNAPGKVAFLMDKWQQSQFAAENSIPMAKTWSVTRTEGFSIPVDVVYPCIVKPEVSAFGNKGDITVCESADMLCATLKKLEDQGYDALVVQQYLQKEYEVCAYGCLTDNADLCAWAMIRKIREYPTTGGGSSCFAQFVEDEKAKTICQRTVSVLYALGYRGQFDLDVLVCPEGAYLNEINFRHGGNGYGLVDNGVHAPYYWCADAVNARIAGTHKTSVAIGKYQMDELTDCRNVKEKNISFYSWLKDFMRTSAFCKLNLRDMKGTFAYYSPLIKGMIKKLFS